MNLSQYIVIFVVGLFLFANLLHPGGWALTIFLIILILIAYAAYEFLPEYILVTNQGKNARKDKRRKRRSRGLNPFSRKSKRDGGRQTETQRQGGNNE